MERERQNRKNRTLAVLICLLLLAMCGQVVSFTYVISAQDDLPSTGPPANFPEGYGVEDYFKAEEYNGPFVSGVLFRRGALILGLLALIASGIGYWYEEKFGAGSYRWPARFLFFFLISIGFQIVTMPYQVAGYLHAHAFGISEVTLVEWIRIKIVSFFVPMALFVFQCIIVYCFMPLFGKRWWVMAALFIFFLGVIPEFIKNRPVELIAELEPLEEGAYRTELDKMGKAVGYELEMFVEDRSTRANTTNVYLGGRAADRFVVLTDTFLKSFTPGEAVVAVAHELGHVENEISALTAHKFLTLVTLLLAFLAAYGLTGRNRIDPKSYLQVVIITVLCLLCAEYVFHPVRTAIARWEERKADEYCLTITENPEDFSSLLVKSARINLAQLKLPPWKYYLFSYYPDILERIEWANTLSFEEG